MKNLSGKAVLITGGASGLGRAMVDRFLAEGARVMIADLDPAGQAIAASLGAGFVQTDVTKPEQVEAAVAACVEAFGALDVFANNAGINSLQAPLHEFDLDNWHKVMTINVDGVIHGLKYALAQMVKQKSGAIINTASIAGLAGLPYVPPYTASKAAVVSLTRTAAVEYGPLGIRINAVAPTAVLTSLIQRSLDSEADPTAKLAFYNSMNPMPGMPLAEDVAAAVAFLASDDARFITGVILPVDGGFTAR